MYQLHNSKWACVGVYVLFVICDAVTYWIVCCLGLFCFVGSVGVAEADTSHIVDDLRQVKPYEQVSPFNQSARCTLHYTP